MLSCPKDCCRPLAVCGETETLTPLQSSENTYTFLGSQKILTTVLTWWSMRNFFFYFFEKFLKCPEVTISCSFKY